MSIFEHVHASVRMNYDIGVSREMNRHRHASIAEMSTRYVDLEGGLVFIQPAWAATCEEYPSFKGNDALDALDIAADSAVTSYALLRECGAPPQEARCVLPLMTATETVITANLREWLHILKLRCDKSAHPDLYRVTRALAREIFSPFGGLAPDLFNIVKWEGGNA